MLLTSKPRENPPAGTHTAILYQIIDLGTQKNDFDKENVKFQPRVRFTWELCEEKMADGRPFAIGKEYTFSANQKATIVQHIKAWTGQDVGKNFEVDSLLGKACNLTVVHNTKQDGTVVASVSGISALKKSEKAPPQVNPSLLFELTPDKFNPEIFKSLPDFFQDKIKLSPEYVAALNFINTAPPANDMPSDEIPF